MSPDPDAAEIERLCTSFLRREVQRIAEVRGWLNTPGKSWGDMPPWIVHFSPLPLAHVTIARWPDPSSRRGDGGWHVDPLTALLWSLLTGLDAAPVDVGECPACAERGGGWDFDDQLSAPFRGLPAWGWTYVGLTCHMHPTDLARVLAQGLDHAGQHLGHWYKRACTECESVDLAPMSPTFGDKLPTGRASRSPARLLLDASHEWGTVSAEGEEMGLEVMREVLHDDPLAPQPGLHMLEPRRARAGDLVIVRSGDAKMREHLAVLADQWQSEGRPAGEWISLWLAGWPKGSREVCTKQMLEASAKLRAY